MSTKEVECNLWGTKFSPSALADIPYISFQSANEPGQIASKGVYKGLPTPYGNCWLVAPPEVKDPIIWLADFVIRHKTDFVKAEASKITFWIRWYGIQGNMELSVEQLSKLAATQVPLAMDYIYTK